MFFEPTPPATQLFATVPTDEELGTLVDPKGRAFTFKVNDGPEALVVRPAGIPWWWIVFSLSMPIGGMCWYFGTKAARHGLDRLEILFIIFACLTIPAVGAVFWGLGRWMVSQGDYFHLDKYARSIYLPRLGVRVPASQVLSMVELRTWYTTRDGLSSSSTWTCELSMLVRTQDGLVARYPVLVGDNAWRVRKIGRQLADFFQVECRTVKSGAGVLTGNSRPSTRAERWLARGFFLLFFAGGCIFQAVMIWATVVVPWNVNHRYGKTECVVREKRLDSSTSTEGAISYRPELLIAYQAAGRDFQCWTYDFPPSTRFYFFSTEGGAHAVLDGFHIGQQYPCWCDPANPADAVLVRGYRHLWWLLFPCPFIAIGVAGLAWQRRKSD